MESVEYSLLPWDSTLLGYQVAQINDPKLDFDSLLERLEKLRKNGIRLIYWSAEKPLNDSQLELINGKMVDTKNTLSLSLDDEASILNSYNSLRTPVNARVLCQLESLAIQSGQYSRFNKDTLFPQDKFESMYREWINNAVKRKMADAILIESDDEEIKGMSTVQKHGNVGDIGLFAIKRDCRGLGLGNKLLRSTIRWFKDQKVSQARVVTQEENKPAMCLYKKNGFSVDHSVYVHHIWL